MKLIGRKETGYRLVSSFANKLINNETTGEAVPSGDNKNADAGNDATNNDNSGSGEQKPVNPKKGKKKK